jgi:hypothetical protein
MGPKSKFRIFSYKNWILLVFKSDVGPGGEGVTKRVTKGDHLSLLFYSYPLIYFFSLINSYPLIDLFALIGENTLASHPSDGFLQLGHYRRSSVCFTKNGFGKGTHKPWKQWKNRLLQKLLFKCKFRM